MLKFFSEWLNLVSRINYGVVASHLVVNCTIPLHTTHACVRDSKLGHQTPVHSTYCYQPQWSCNDRRSCQQVHSEHHLTSQDSVNSLECLLLFTRKRPSRFPLEAWKQCMVVCQRTTLPCHLLQLTPSNRGDLWVATKAIEENVLCVLDFWIVKDLRNASLYLILKKVHKIG